jgi:hypothetical protein
MDDKDCKDACVGAYKARVSKLFDVLAECLIEAGSEGAKQECSEHFRRGLRAAREAREICTALCDE